MSDTQKAFKHIRESRLIVKQLGLFVICASGFGYLPDVQCVYWYDSSIVINVSSKLNQTLWVHTAILFKQGS